ncbi:LacI family DNA-binding transcriptional regulator [Gottfriedia acidiceleris]|uniref:LacI family transcriptional regulator n=1 Tax=Gottfriedia acidiceleris TaxID=371036 RepID=A0ABY4JPV7_9BACI|nr:LacI family DNA-binding transcriptional regulator [Gottfriedia acidiceleris]UPM55537.1 LacI family transcriptional regulator [Gottfriedia acidiceleris]
MSVTIYDVAKHAGVSIATVSRVINEHPSVKSETKKKVFEVIDRLQYQYNAAAGVLASGRTNTVALVTPNNINPFYAEVAEGIYYEALNKGINIVTTNMSLNKDNDIPYLNKQNVDGLLLMDMTAKQVAKLNKQVENLVIIGNDLLDSKANCVITDNFAGIQLAMHFLFENGHEKVALISEPPIFNDIKDRVRAYQIIMEEKGLSSFREVIDAKGCEIVDGEQIGERILKNGLKHTAYLVTNDLLAIGVKKAFEAAGNKVPSDVSIVGFDGSWITNIVYPSLTTIKQPMHELGSTALTLLLDLLDSDRTSARKIVLNPTLQIGGTVSKINHK